MRMHDDDSNQRGRQMGKVLKSKQEYQHAFTQAPTPGSHYAEVRRISFRSVHASRISSSERQRREGSALAESNK